MFECGEGIRIILGAIAIVIVARLMMPKDDELYP